MKLTWKQCTSVTPGGKKFFYYAKCKGHSYHAVYCRIDDMIHAQQDHHTLGKFTTILEAIGYLGEVASKPN